MQANGESQGRLQQVIGESRAAIEAMAIRFGMSKDEARKYTDQLLTIPGRPRHPDQRRYVQGYGRDPGAVQLLVEPDHHAARRSPG